MDSVAGLGESSLHSSLSLWSEERALGEDWGWNGPLGGHNQPNRQDREPGSRGSIECLPDPVLATLGQKVQAVPRRLRGRGQAQWAVRLPRDGWPLKEAGGWAANSWKGSVMKTPDGDHLREGSPFPCVADKGQEIPQLR